MAPKHFVPVLFILFFAALLELLPVASGSTNINMCDWREALPQLYHEYGIEDCPAHLLLEDDGNCPSEKDGHRCSGFCQVRTNFFYGQEQPYVRVPMCRGGMTCTVSESVHQNYAWKVKINGSFKLKALTMGITMGYSEKSGISQSYKFSKRIQDDECGYFTFVPIVREVCGTYSEGPFKNGQCNNDLNIGNACVEELVGFDTNDNIMDWRSIRGIVVFVYVDCLTLQPLPDEKQDVAWTQPGVRLPRDNDLAAAYENFWNQSVQVNMASQNDQATCSRETVANASDCTVAAQALLENGDSLVSTHNAKDGKGHTVAKSDSCSVYITYDENWKGQDCQVSYLEVAAAAQAIMDSCQNGDVIGGQHVVRAPGHCACTVSFKDNGS